ncbi:MAG: ComF family protein [Clostridiales bacterium]|nr:ComF family protein [Clostridiales bacterium]
MSAVAGLWSRVLNLVYPPRCVFCQDFLTGERTERGVCAACEQALPRTDGTTALRPGDYFTFCLSPLLYQGVVRESIRRYKFSGRSYYHRVYGVFLRSCLKERLPSPPDVVTWAPLSARRKRRRGYDQAKLLAEEAGKLYGLRPVPLLKKVRHTPAQSSLGRAAREENVQGVYRIRPDASVSGKRVLLVDDIITTGSTLSECSRVLLKSGAAEVVCLTLARTMGGGKERPGESAR